jgi:glutamine synthetase
MHTHVSLWRDDANAFVDAGDAYGLSPLAYRFIAGLLAHAKEITAVTNQWVNSYKRLVPGHEAPVHVSWARNNRSALVRVPTVKPSKTDSTRVEYRAPDSAANPYLCFAVILAAGMAGVRGGYELPEEATGNLFDHAEGRGLERLPSSLKEAIDTMAESQLLHDTLGEHVVEWFLRNKREEWSGYAESVTPFELDRYLPLL